MVPITAAAHATRGMLIYLLGRNLWHGPVGMYGGMIAAILFVGFPPHCPGTASHSGWIFHCGCFVGSV